ncbi:MAG: spore maturation protein [Clostridia bacterium]|nr:spore maturation protein [Clostridia bacterium]
MSLSVFITPALIILLLIYCAKKKINCYGTFAEGAKGAIQLCLDVLPFLVAIFVAIQLFKISGLASITADLLAPVMNLVGIPKELTELMIIRPFSGSGSIVIAEQIFSDFGADSYIARCASVIMGSSETIFYVATIYFSQTKAKRLLYAIPVALVATIASSIVACQICKIM